MLSRWSDSRMKPMTHPQDLGDSRRKLLSIGSVLAMAYTYRCAR